MRTESIVAGIYKDAIGLKDVRLDARFLDIGGNSRNLVTVLKRIKEATGVSPSPRLFFGKATSSIAAISAEIERQRSA